jgi:hypothetical protein
MPVHTVEATRMGHTDNVSSSVHASLFLKAIEVVGAKLHADVQRSNKLLSAMKEIHALNIDPKDGYVAASMQQTAVQS